MNTRLEYSTVPMAPSATSTRFAIWARSSLALDWGRVGVMFGKGGRSIRTKENVYAEQGYKSIVGHRGASHSSLPPVFRPARATAAYVAELRLMNGFRENGRGAAGVIDVAPINRLDRVCAGTQFFGQRCASIAQRGGSKQGCPIEELNG